MNPTTLTKTKAPGLWYPAGAGGMWLNYVTWCSHNQTIIPGQHLNFEFPYLKNLNPEYSPFFHFHRHQESPYVATVILGSDRALFNFFLNILLKKQSKPDWMPTAGGFYQMKNVIKYNLDWCNIFENPIQFFADVNLLTGYNIKLDQYTEAAVEQYKHSCTWYSLSKNQLYELKLVQECVDHCFHNHTDLTLDVAQRQHQSQQLVSETLWHRNFDHQAVLH